MSGISLSSSMRNNLLSLQNTSMLQDMTQERLSTGKKVNSAIDNPTSFFTAFSLNNRATDLSNRMDGIGQALQTLKATDKTLTSITKLVESAKALATQASEAAGATVTSLSSVEGKSVSAVTNMVASTTNTLATGITVAFGNVDSTDKKFKISINGATAVTVSFSNTNAISEVLTAINNNASVAAADAKAYFNTTTRKIEFAAKEGTTLAFSDYSTTATFATKVFSATAFTFSAPASSTLATKAFEISATNNFYIQVTNNNTGITGNTQTINISTTTTITGLVDLLNNVDSNLKATYNTDSNKIEFANVSGIKVGLTEQGADLEATQIFGASAVATDITMGSAGSSTTIAANLSDFKEVMSQIDQLVNDASYKGKNLLKGSDTMQVLFNEDASSKLTVQGVNFTYNGGLGFTATASLSWTTSGNIEASITEAKNALNTIRDQAAKFGTSSSIIQTREDFSKEMVNTLKAGADKLVLADMNEEAANMLALQTQRSLGTNSLSMASQAAQSVLQMFR